MKDEKKTKEIYIFTSDVDVEECCTFFNPELKISFQQFLIFLSFVNMHIVYNIIYIYMVIVFIQKQPSIGVLIKKCFENMQQIYRRAAMSKCNFNKVVK